VRCAIYQRYESPPSEYRLGMLSVADLVPLLVFTSSVERFVEKSTVIRGSDIESPDFDRTRHSSSWL
jgi:hypothetical protein